MKTYKQYLSEEWESYNKRHSHTADVKGHKVTVYVGHEGKGTYQASYTVNDQFEKNPPAKRARPNAKSISSAHAPLIARHAAMKIKEFVANNKPSKFKFSAFNRDHEEAFNRFAAKLAAAHGYKHETEPNHAQTDHILTKMRKRKPKAE